MKHCIIVDKDSLLTYYIIIDHIKDSMILGYSIIKFADNSLDSVFHDMRFLAYGYVTISINPKFELIDLINIV